MKYKTKDTLQTIAGVTILALMIIVTIAVVILRVWVYTKYGDTPVTELPAWVWWIMQDGG